MSNDRYATEDEITASLARQAAADRMRMSVKHGFADGGAPDRWIIPGLSDAIAQTRQNLQSSAPPVNNFGSTFPERVAGVAERLKETLPGRIAQSAYDAFTAPGRAWRGEFGDPGSEEFIRNAVPEATNLAQFMVGSGIASAERGAVGSAGGKLRPYENVPDSLMGFRKSGQNKGFYEQGYPYTQNLRIDLGNGNVFEDSVKGMNKEHALERARRNWPDAVKIMPIDNFADGGAAKDEWITPADEWVTPGAEAPAPSGGGISDYIPSAISDIPSEIYSAGKTAVSAINAGLNPFSEERRASLERQAHAPSFLSSIGEGIKQYGDVGRGLLAVPELAAAPVTGTARSAIGHPYSALTGIPYEEAKQDVDTALMALRPSAGGLRAPVAIPPRPTTGPLGVTLSEGQATRELPLIQREQAALRGQAGERAQGRAQEFADQQRTQLATARERIAQGFDPFQQTIAETPQEAGALVSESMQRAAAQRKAAVKQAYEEAKSYPGEIHAGAFEGIGQKIKSDLSFRDEPIIIDDKLTPFASRAIQDIDNRVSNLQIQNRADPFGQPNQENIIGVNLQGVDQMRKRLSAFRRDAFASGNAADGRAAKAVLDAFDDQVTHAVNNGLFNGDPRAVQAWNDARAAHADYKSTFSAKKGDPVGRVVEKIIGNQNNPAAIPNDVADFLYGGTGVNPNSLNVGVANRVKGVLGEHSPEWSAVRQGLFSRLVEPAPGVTDFGPGRVAQRLNRFLNGDGKEMAQAMYSAPERRVMQQYADIMRQIEVPQSGANWSNTATFSARALERIGGRLGMVVGAALGHYMLPGLPWGMAEGVGAGAAALAGKGAKALQARQIGRQMPLVADAMKQWQKAVGRAQKANRPPSGAAVAVATANLARSLKPLGINMDALMAGSGSKDAEAQEQKP